MNREDDEQLWDVLGHAKRPEVSPFFARDVLRRIRQEPGWKISLRSWLSWRRLVPATGLAAAIISAMVLTHQPRAGHKAISAEPDPIAKIDPQDYEVVADLDVLLASEDNNLWDDDDNSSL